MYISKPYTPPLHSYEKLPSPQESPKAARAWDASREFESLFVSQFIQQLFAANKEGLFGGGETEVMFRSVWAEKIAENMPPQFGIAESVYPILLKKQEEM